MRAQNRTLIAACALTAAFASFLLVPPVARANDAAAQTNPEVRVTTNMGSFVIELRPDRAPLTVANFLRYVRAGFYNNTLFHRVVANFVIQGGGHEATPPYALKPTYPPVDNESGNGLQNKRGAVGLARAAAPDTGNSQFYINLVDNPELDPLPTRWGYAVFGKVVQGMNVVDSIGVVPTGAFGPFKSDAPLKPVIIESIQEITPQLSPSASGTPAAAPSATPPSGAQSSGSAASGSSASGTSSSATSGSATSGSGASKPAAAPSGSAPSQPGGQGAGSPAPSGTKPATPPPSGAQSSGATPPPAASPSQPKARSKSADAGPPGGASSPQ
jgi:cyclophilin family peptidyl-prolyl cis-trans isomerase